MGNKPKANLYSTKNQWVPNYCKHSGDALKKKMKSKSALVIFVLLISFSQNILAGLE